MVGKKKLFFCWTCGCEVVSLDLLRSHVGPGSVAHTEGSEAERWRVPEISVSGTKSRAFHLHESVLFLFKQV